MVEEPSLGKCPYQHKMQTESSVAPRGKRSYNSRYWQLCKRGVLCFWLGVDASAQHSCRVREIAARVLAAFLRAFVSVGCPVGQQAQVEMEG